MATLWFSPPVYVKTERTGVRYGVNHVQGAAEQLLKWTRRGPNWKQAVGVCMAAMEGEEVSPQVVRKAFEAAAKEERMLLPAQ